MGVFSRSWDLTKSTLYVMKKDKEIFVFPILAIIIALIFLGAFVVFSVIAGLISLIGGFNMQVLGYILLLILYFILAIVSTFFSVCVVYTAAIRFNNKDATFGQSLKFALKRLPRIFLWAVTSATVGIILKILENFAKKARGVAKIFFNIFNWLLGAIWGIATIFVIQGIVYKDLNPFAAIKDSVITLKKTWGESLIKYLGLGMIEFLFLIPALLIGIPLIILGTGIGIGFILTVILLMFAYITVVVIFFNIADEVFDTALYVYANTGKVPEGYSEDQMKNAFKSQKNVFSLE
jgi:hypothetical protein